MTELYLVRHGETASNGRGVYCGWQDVALTEKGILQAREVGEKLKDRPLDRIIASDLRRTRQTAEIINGHHGVEIQGDRAFREMNFGLWEGLSYEGIKNRYPRELEAWEKDWLHYSVPEGESLKEMYDRVTARIDQLIGNGAHEKILIVAHGGSIRAILAYLIGRGVEDCWRYKVDHCKIAKIEIADHYPVLAGFNQ
ncbi:alpha-ribazole phosphatase [Thermotalea metallivorans]|uniref:Alpha-ribazole phosphatase n=1 Tax=Thermotalea metallivorans TaxID=520762 RepID=A0A140LEE9_9FIRM|nr:alpha-ribazole phosphatase [Thermotalea metallivorans]KXG78924.1 putative phosphoserine phosphatase 2 [Thermotalea metallivorans]